MILCALFPFACVIYLACPYLFSYCKYVREKFIFCAFINFPLPLFHSLKDPHHYGVANAESVTIETLDGVINSWVINAKVPFMKNDKQSTILYCHGQSCNRAMSHRVGMYNKLSKMGFNVVAFDYRGFGDSIGGNPSEESVIQDSKTMLLWVKEYFPDHNIFVWGHSLGTGVSVKLLSTSEDCSHTISGLVLESPFRNLEEAGKYFPIARVFNLLPITAGVISRALAGMFPTDDLIVSIKVPILILHAENDPIIPVKNAWDLYKACERNSMENVAIRTFKEGKHKFLFKNNDAMHAAATFLKA